MKKALDILVSIVMNTLLWALFFVYLLVNLLLEGLRSMKVKIAVNDLLNAALNLFALTWHVMVLLRLYIFINNGFWSIVSIAVGIALALTIMYFIVKLIFRGFVPEPPIVKEARVFMRILKMKFRLPVLRTVFIYPDGRIRIHVTGKRTLPDEFSIAATLQRRIEIETDYRGRSAIIIHPSQV